MTQKTSILRRLTADQLAKGGRFGVEEWGTRTSITGGVKTVSLKAPKSAQEWLEGLWKDVGRKLPKKL